MYLKEIQMENFKTFRKKVSIPVFKGFTGITGPNGSGKSNIADAILFVLGPRSSRMVRAKKLSDLIFHGNDRFKGAKECQVALVFDNTDRIIPIDSDEVTLKRIIKKSASDPDSTLSYFYVNGRPSSQGQFENILTHAHLSAEGYNIVLQGHINEFIGKTPLRVREEIDDIAGIRKYDDEIKVALNKKDKTEENMERIRWHLDFIRSRLRELKKEKEEAEKYRSAQMRINNAKATLYNVQKTVIEGELEGYRNAIDNSERRKIELRGEIDKVESEKSEIEGKIRELEIRIDEITGEEGKKLKEKLDEARLELMRAKDVIETSEDTKNELNGERKLRTQEIADIGRKKKSLNKEIDESITGIEKADTDIEKVRKQIDDLEAEMERSDMDLLNIRRDLGKVSKDLEAKRENLSGMILDRDRSGQLLESKRSVLSDVQQMITTLRYEIKDMKDSVKEMKRTDPSEQLNKLQKRFMEIRGEERHLVDVVKELEREITSLNRLYTSLKVEYETSEKLKKGMSLAVDDILTARDTGEIRGIYGTIGELGKVSEKYATALEVAAGSRINAVVVEDDQVAANCIERLKRKKIGRATFLPLNKISAKRPGAKSLMIKDDPHVVGMAIDLVNFDKTYGPAFSWVFGDTVVVDNLETMRRLMGGVRLVSLQGEIAGSGGDLTGGSRSASKSGPGFGKRSKNEMDDVAARLQEKTAESASAAARLNEIRDEVHSLETEIRRMTSNEESVVERKKRMEETMAASSDQLKTKEEEEASLLKDIEELERSGGSSEDDIGKMENLITELSERRDRLADALDRATPKSIRDRLRGMREKRDDHIEKRSSFVERRDSSRAQVKMFDERLSELEDRIRKIDEGVKKADKELEEARVREDKFGKEVKALETVLTTIDEKTKGLYQKLTELNRDVEKAIGRKEAYKHDLMVQDQIIITQRSNIRLAEDKLADVLRELQHFKGIDIGEGPYPSERELQKTVRDLDAILANVGNVNLKALEEFEEMEVKKNEIMADMKALEKEKDELVKLIDEINQKRTSEFMHAYEGIDKNFRRIYGHISGGGEAYFELEAPEDPLSAGLVIRVKPPGKKMTQLGSLSGGEKSLTSMAFIFAVQAWDPSPCYLLDEVDQNLDAVNAEIVANMIRENSRYAQFILISLRKISLKEAHHLYGVTLQAGNSVVLGRVDIKDVEDYDKRDQEGPAKAETAAGGEA
ncbi:MAG: chromosome segregation protein SMC [Thermoplasmatota archaeon]